MSEVLDPVAMRALLAGCIQPQSLVAASFCVGPDGRPGPATMSVDHGDVTGRGDRAVTGMLGSNGQDPVSLRLPSPSPSQLLEANGHHQAAGGPQALAGVGMVLGREEDGGRGGPASGRHYVMRLVAGGPAEQSGKASARTGGPRWYTAARAGHADRQRQMDKRGCK